MESGFFVLRVQGRIDVQSLSFRVAVAIFGRILVGFDICLNPVLLCLITDAKMVLERMLMAMSLVSVIMFVRNIVLVMVCLSSGRLVQAS